MQSIQAVIQHILLTGCDLGHTVPLFGYNKERSFLLIKMPFIYSIVTHPCRITKRAARKSEQVHDTNTATHLVNKRM